MSHGDMKDRVFAFYDGELGPEERAGVQRHLDACPDCRAELAAWKASAERFFRPSPVPVSEDFVRSVMDRLEERDLPRENFWERLRLFLNPPRLALAGAAALAAVFILRPDRAAVAPEPDAAVLHVVDVLEASSSEDAALDAPVEEYFLS